MNVICKNKVTQNSLLKEYKNRGPKAQEFQCQVFFFFFSLESQIGHFIFLCLDLCTREKHRPSHIGVGWVRQSRSV